MTLSRSKNWQEDLIHFPEEPAKLMDIYFAAIYILACSYNWGHHGLHGKREAVKISEWPPLLWSVQKPCRNTWRELTVLGRRVSSIFWWEIIGGSGPTFHNGFRVNYGLLSSFNVSLRLTSKYTCMIPLFPWAERQQNRGLGLWLQIFILPTELWGTMTTIYLTYLFNKSGIAVLVKMSSWQHYLVLCRASERWTSADSIFQYTLVSSSF